MCRTASPVLALLTCLACVPAGDDGEAEESGSTDGSSETGVGESAETGDTGGTCLPPETPAPHTWTVDLEALPEVENDEVITGENSLFLELTCPNTTAAHDGSFVDYTIECDHPDAGTVTIAFSIEAGGLPPGFDSGPVATTLHIDASVQVGGAKDGPQALVAGHQRIYLTTDADGPIAVVQAGLGTTGFSHEDLSVSLETDCGELDPSDDAAGYYRGQVGAGDPVDVPVGQVDSFSGDYLQTPAEYELRVFQATMHGCCHGHEGSFTVARVG